ncbi:MAG: choice-of-anchor O protein, partial [Pseudomonadota bacterium]
MKLLPMSLALLIASTPLLADDGQMLRRSVSSPPGITEDPEPHGAHAFVSLMNFRVPTQRANGTVEPVEYYNIDDALVMTLETAKPLINVYVYGPSNGFDDFSQSGFAGHGRRDAFGAVSLDDGETWKVTNLSNSGDESSFVIADPIPDPGLPVGDADGTCDLEDIIETASWEDFTNNRNFGRLAVAGEADSRDRIDIINGVTGDELFSVRATRDGDFERERNVALSEAPCTVAAVIDDVQSCSIEVEGAPEDCVGEEVDPTLITDYPGDVTNIFHSTAGNRVLAAWQSKFCQAGNPGFSLEDDEKDALAAYLEIDPLVDLYLEDLFVVGGSQASTDYREQEEFPGEYDDVAEVPYSCLWSARGILRENPEVADTTQLVWMQAERLTSGRRDVNRVETACVAGAGCAVTWQEDPEGVRPGSGEGPGTGWSGATTASKTDIWYSYTPWEFFDYYSPTADIADAIPLADNTLESKPKAAV